MIPCTHYQNDPTDCAVSDEEDSPTGFLLSDLAAAACIYVFHASPG